MTAQTFDPANVGATTYDPNEAASVSMTDVAITHIRKQLARNPAMHGVRLAVKKSGCSGFKYDIEFVEQASEGDQTIDIADGVKLFIDAEAAAYVRGTEIDFSKEGLNSVIKFNNPNAKDLCGCGESFSV